MDKESRKRKHEADEENADEFKAPSTKRKLLDDEDVYTGLNNVVNSKSSQPRDEEIVSLTDESLEIDEFADRPRIAQIYYINGNKLTVGDLKDGRRIFNNKTERTGFSGFRPNFIEFRQLLFENLLLTSDFEENLQEKWTIESALFSTFCYDEEFIEPLVSQYKIKTLIIKHNDSGFKLIEEKSDLLTFYHPKIDFTLKWGKFHSKLMILKFPGFLRVIIPTANLTNCDWYYWGQLLWFQDFPLKKKNQTYIQSDFEKYLHKVLETTAGANYQNSKHFKKIEINLSEYDFSNTVVDLVASTSGRFADNQSKDFGVGRLTALTESYKLRKKFTHKRLIAQCSSIGKVKDKFINDFKSCFQVKDELMKASRLDILFPSIDYVKGVPLGEELASCLFLDNDTFLQHKYKFRKFALKDEYNHIKTVWHSKLFIACDEGDLDVNTISDHSIMYFGSHNLSPSAWGNFEKNNTQVSMANYELGVLFNPIKLRYEEKQEIISSLLMNLNSCYYDGEKAWCRETFN
jgi:tyrosyl-DNA phosphodiesterase-1